MSLTGLDAEQVGIRRNFLPNSDRRNARMNHRRDKKRPIVPLDSVFQSSGLCRDHADNLLDRLRLCDGERVMRQRREQCRMYQCG